MIDNILIEILNFRWLIITYIVVTILICAGFWLYTSNFCWSQRKMRIFGALYGLDRRGRISVALILSRFIFVMITALLCSDIGLYHYVVLLLLSILINVIEIDFKGLFENVCVYFAIFSITFLESMLYHYCMEIEGTWGMRSMAILLGVFVILYGAYHMLLSYDKVLTRGKQ